MAVTLKDIAARVNKSVPTVSRALGDFSDISPETRREVRRVADEMGYVPSKQALHFARNKAYRLGFVIPVYRSFPTFSRAYFPSLLDGAVLGAEENGYLVTIVCDSITDHFQPVCR